LFENLRLHSGARHDLAEQRGVLILQTGSRGADQDKTALDPGPDLGFPRGIQDVLDRGVAVAAVVVEVDPHLAVFGQRYPEIADPHVKQSPAPGIAIAPGAGPT